MIGDGNDEIARLRRQMNDMQHVMERQRKFCKTLLIVLLIAAVAAVTVAGVCSNGNCVRSTPALSSLTMVAQSNETTTTAQPTAPTDVSAKVEPAASPPPPPTGSPTKPTMAGPTSVPTTIKPASSTEPAVPPPSACPTALLTEEPSAVSLTPKVVPVSPPPTGLPTEPPTTGPSSAPTTIELAASSGPTVQPRSAGPTAVLTKEPTAPPTTTKPTTVPTTTQEPTKEPAAPPVMTNLTVVTGPPTIAVPMTVRPTTKPLPTSPTGDFAYTVHFTGGCKDRNELGITKGVSVRECADLCDKDLRGASFEYRDSDGKCHRSTSCDSFDMTVNAKNATFDWYLKNTRPPTLPVGYTAFFTGGCVGRNELGGAPANSTVRECANTCNDSELCVSFEYNVPGRFCQYSTSCDSFDMTAKHSGSKFAWYLKGIE